MIFKNKVERFKQFHHDLTRMFRRHSNHTKMQLSVNKRAPSTHDFLVCISQETFECLSQETSIVILLLQIRLLLILKELFFDLVKTGKNVSGNSYSIDPSQFTSFNSESPSEVNISIESDLTLLPLFRSIKDPNLSSSPLNVSNLYLLASSRGKIAAI